MAHEFIAKNGLVVGSGNTHAVNSISDDSGITYSNNVLLTSNAIKGAVEESTRRTGCVVRNDTSQTITKGRVVSETGVVGGVITVVPHVSANGTTNRVAGLVQSDIPSGTTGLVMSYGVLTGVDLTGFPTGTFLYSSDTTPGGYVGSTGVLQVTSRVTQLGLVLVGGVTGGTIMVCVEGENLNLTTTSLERNILEGNVMSTGMYSYSGMTKITSNTFSISSASGWIVNNTYEYAMNPRVTHVEYPGATGITPLYLNTAASTHVLINSASTMFMLPTFPTNQQRRENIYIGKVVHPDNTSILSINNIVDHDMSPMSSLRDMFTSMKYINDSCLVSPNGTNLNINLSAGKMYGMGINWVNNQKNPNEVIITASSPKSFLYKTLTGGTSSIVTDIDPTVYDDGGNITSVPTGGDGKGDRSTNQRVYLYPTGIINIQYGQQYYDTLPLALAAQQTEAFVKCTNVMETAILIGLIAVRRICTDLSDKTMAVFTPASMFGESVGGVNGISTTTLQQAYDNSVTPEIVTDSARGALTMKTGTGDNSTLLFECINSGNTQTFSVRGDGRTMVSDAVLNTEAVSLQQLNSGLTLKQDHNSKLDSLTGLSYGNVSFVKMTGANTFSLDTTVYTPNTINIIANTGTGSVIGGGDLSSNRTLILDGDSTTPGNNKLYGTNSGGTKGWYERYTSPLSLVNNTVGFTVSGGTTAKSLTVNNNITISGVDGSTINISSGGTLGSAAFTSSSSYQPISVNLTSLSGLSYNTNSIVRMTTGGTFGLDNTDYTTLTGIGYVTGNMTGFKDISQVITFSGGTTRTLYVTPSGVSFDVYIKGRMYTKSTIESIQISDVEGIHFIYYNSNCVLTETTIFDDSFIVSYAPVAILYWDADNKKAITRSDEKHNVARERFMHRLIHLTQGVGYVSGLGLTNFLIDDGAVDANLQFNVGDGELYDEDIEIIIKNNIPQQLQVLNAPVFYRSGTTWRRDDASTLPYKSFVGGSGRLAYNNIVAGSGSQLECADNSFVNYYIFATNDVDYPIAMVQGTINYNSVSYATQNMANGINNFVEYGLPFIEYTPIGAVVVKTSSSYANTKKATIVTNSRGESYKDLRVNYKTNKYSSVVSWDGKTMTVADTNADFNSIKSAVDWFNTFATSNVQIRVAAGTYNQNDTVTVNNPSYSLNILGAGVYVTSLISASGLTNKPMFVFNSEAHISRLDIDGSTLTSYGNLSTENCVEVTSPVYCEVKDAIVSGFNNGIRLDSQGSELWMLDSEISDCKSNALVINGGNVTQNVCWFENNNNGVYIYSGNTLHVEVKNSTFVVNTGQTALVYNGTGVTYGILAIASNTFDPINSAVTLVTGFDYSLLRDAGVRVIGNTGLIDNTPSAYYQFKNNVTNTNLIVQNTYYKALGTNTASTGRKFSIIDNRATYLPSLSRELSIFVTGSVTAGTNTRTLSMGIYKNGTTLLEECEVSCATSTLFYTFAVNTVVSSVSPGDFFELWFTCTSNANLATARVRDLQFIIRS